MIQALLGILLLYLPLFLVIYLVGKFTLSE